MLAMSDINCIKHLRNNKGLSISEIQRTMGINWCNRQVELNNFPQIILNSFLQLRFNSLLN